jgi:hypothetical protein
LNCPIMNSTIFMGLSTSDGQIKQVIRFDHRGKSAMQPLIACLPTGEYSIKLSAKTFSP